MPAAVRYMNTTAVISRVSFIDGAKGILRYRGYPIEQLAEKANFIEVCLDSFHDVIRSPPSTCWRYQGAYHCSSVCTQPRVLCSRHHLPSCTAEMPKALASRCLQHGHRRQYTTVQCTSHSLHTSCLLLRHDLAASGTPPGRAMCFTLPDSSHKPASLVNVAAWLAGIVPHHVWGAANGARAGPLGGGSHAPQRHTSSRQECH